MKTADQSGGVDFALDIGQLSFYLTPAPFVLGRASRRRLGPVSYKFLEPWESYSHGEFFFYWLISRQDLATPGSALEYRWHLSPNVGLSGHNLSQDPRSRFATLSSVETLAAGTSAIRGKTLDILKQSTGESPFLTNVAFQLHGIDCFFVDRLYREAVKRSMALATIMNGGLLVVDLGFAAGGEDGAFLQDPAPPALPRPPPEPDYIEPLAH